jgi:putative FmdB family regulatory protein
MPIYLYETLATGETFEHLQGLHDAPLTAHPETGQAVRRVVAAPGLALKHGEAATRRTLAPRQLARHGFTRYEKTAPGHYVKTAGDPAAPRELRG